MSPGNVRERRMTERMANMRIAAEPSGRPQRRSSARVRLFRAGRLRSIRAATPMVSHATRSKTCRNHEIVTIPTPTPTPTPPVAEPQEPVEPMVEPTEEPQAAEEPRELRFNNFWDYDHQEDLFLTGETYTKDETVFLLRVRHIQNEAKIRKLRRINQAMQMTMLQVIRGTDNEFCVRRAVGEAASDEPATQELVPAPE